MVGFALPFGLTAGGILIALVFFVMGYILGSAIKSGAKYIVIFIFFIFSLYLLGYITADIFSKIQEGIGFLKGYISLITTLTGGQANFSTQVYAFIVGVVVGLWR